MKVHCWKAKEIKEREKKRKEEKERKKDRVTKNDRKRKTSDAVLQYRRRWVGGGIQPHSTHLLP